MVVQEVTQTSSLGEGCWRRMAVVEEECRSTRELHRGRKRGFGGEHGS
jgi:hypothetical protein